MMQEASRLALPGMRLRVVRLPVLTVVMTFAIAVAAEAFSPMPATLVQNFKDQDCAPALTIGLTSASTASAGTWLQLVKSDAVACATRQ